jgi:hypothetical protein
MSMKKTVNALSQVILERPLLQLNLIIQHLHDSETKECVCVRLKN